MKKGVQLLVAILFCLGAAKAATHLVTTASIDNLNWPIVSGSFAEAVYNSQNTGDTIIFDFASIGGAPIQVDGAFFYTAIGGFVIDGLRGKPNGVDKIKIQTAAAPGVNQGLFYIGNANTTIIGLDFMSVNGNGLWITSSNTIIDSCLIHNMNYHGVTVTASASNTTIKNSLIYDNNQTPLGSADHDNAGIYSLSDVVIDSCFVYGNSSNGILIKSSAANGSKVTNTVIGKSESGVDSGNDWNGVFVWAANNVTVENCIVVNNGKNPAGDNGRVSGICFQESSNGVINGNYCGTDPLKSNAGNAFEGITVRGVYAGSANISSTSINNNIICYNGFHNNDGGGLGLRYDVSGSTITSNYLGFHADSTDGGNYDYGLSLEWRSANNIVDDNLIGNSKATYGSKKGCGVWLVSSGTSNNRLTNNYIQDNSGPGVLIQGGGSGSSKGNIVGTQNNGNTISGNLHGVLVTGSGVNNHTIRYNSFSCNANGGISLQSSGNDNYGNASVATFPKSILVNSNEKRANYVSGLAPSANASVDIYVSDSNCPADCDSDVNQGFTYVATVTASSTAEPNGLYLWEYDITASPVTQDNVVVLATESGTAGQVNTSEFSVCAVFCNTPDNSNIAVNDADICVGETAELSVSPTGLGVGEDYSYTWFRNDLDQDSIVSYLINDNSFSTDIPGTYYVQISSQIDSAVCNDTSDAQIITLNEIPVVTLESDTDTICELKGTQLELRASVEPSLTGNLEWKPNGELNVNSIIIDKAGSYIATFTSNAGCKGSDTLKVVNYCIPPDPEVPNVVTDQSPWKPIGEIQNDQFVSSEFVVYDRWGLKMYSSDEVLPEWKGKKDNGNSCPAGVYYWIWKYKDISGEEYTYNGFLQLLIP